MMKSRSCGECRRTLPRHGQECSQWVPEAPPPEWESDRPAHRSDVDRQLEHARPDDFRSPAGLGQFAFFGLVLLFGAFLFSLTLGLRYRSIIIGLIDGTFDGSFQQVIDVENAYAYSDWLGLAGLVVIALTWLLWMRRLRANVVALGRRPEYRPAWIFWGWVTPILSYFRPYQVIADLWRGSKPDLGVGSGEPPRYYLAWWIMFVISGQISQGIVRSLHEPESLEELQSLVDLLVVMDLIQVPSLVLAVMVIRSLTRRQIDAGARLGRHLGTRQG